MNAKFYTTTGISLIIGSFLAIVTMVLHPSGGSFEHIVQMAQPIKAAHTLAITCLPFILFGFYGLTHKLLATRKLSVLPFIIIAFGLFAAMLAALFNGLILPSFLEHYSGNLAQENSGLQQIVNYGFTINQALDYVFIVSLCIAISIYSLLIINSIQKLPKWIGYLGLLILVLALIGAATNFSFTSLLGFRIFVFGIVGWLLAVGGAMVRSKV